MRARKPEPQPMSQHLKLASSLLAGLAAFIAVLGAVWVLLHRDGESPATVVAVEGAFHKVPADAVTEIVRPMLDGAFGELDLAQVRAEVERLPWVARARVERQWPDAVRVRVWERQAVARWGDDALLDANANVFHPPLTEITALSLPQLRAPAGHEQEVLQTWRKFSAELERTDFAPVAMSMDARGEWISRAAQGIELRLGRDAPETHVALIRGALTRALQANLAQVAYVDLRYGNGFSVGWAAPQAPPPVKEEGSNNG